MLLDKYPERFVTIDASKEVEEVLEEVYLATKKELEKY